MTFLYIPCFVSPAISLRFHSLRRQFPFRIFSSSRCRAILFEQCQSFSVRGFFEWLYYFRRKNPSVCVNARLASDAFGRNDFLSLSFVGRRWRERERSTRRSNISRKWQLLQSMYGCSSDLIVRIPFTPTFNGSFPHFPPSIINRVA